MIHLIFFICLGEIDFGKPVPSSDWSFVEAPTQGIYDAVVLEDATSIYETAIIRYRRVRVLSEVGKAAAEFYDLTGSIKKMEGRVVYPDGSETRFGQTSDLEEVLLSKQRGNTSRLRILVPPGLTDDCVVEMSWTIPAYRGLPLNQAQYFQEIPEQWYVKEKSFIFNTIKQTNNMLYSVRQIWTRTSDNHFSHEKNPGHQKVTYRDFAPREEVPFGNPYRHDNAHFVYSFLVFAGFAPKVEDYWDDVAKKYVRSEIFNMGFKPGSDYDKWVNEVRAQLPGDPVKAMTFLQDAFRQRLASTALLSPEQAQKVKKETTGKEDPEMILGNAFKRGYGSPDELALIFYHFAKDVGVKFRLVFPSDVDAKPFDPRTFDSSNINFTQPLFAVGPKENPILFSPFKYAYGPGFFHPDYEGMPALSIDPEDRWNLEFITMPSNGSASNRLITQAKTEIKSDLSIQMSIKRQTTGIYLARYRNFYYPLPADERNNALMKEWENLGTFTVEEAVVDGADDLNGLVTERVSMRIPASDSDISAYVIDPFPRSYRPIESPSNWPTHRDQDIFLPFASQHIDINVITVPEGWVLRGENNWERRNVAGLIKFQAVQEGTKITVRRDISLDHNYLDRAAEPQLKTFLAWMDEAYAQQIGFILPGGNP